jgi:hypothetical protein
MMSRAKLAAARELIEEKKYDEARTLLLTIKDDPTAAKWLAQLETRMNRAQGSPPQVPQLSQSSSPGNRPPARSAPPASNPLPSNYAVISPTSGTLRKARELYEAGRGMEARSLLLTIKDDPFAARMLDEIEQQRRRYDAQFAAPAAAPPPVESIGMAGVFRVVWGLLTLLAVGWIGYGLLTSLDVTGTQLNSAAARSSQGFQAGTLIGGGIGITFFLCTGLPFFLIFGLLYWRNGVAIRETKKHNQMIAAVQRRP